MMLKVKFKRPTNSEIENHLKLILGFDFNYDQNLDLDNASGFDHDKNTIVLGAGEEIWSKAKTSLNNWKQFPAGWASPHPLFQDFEKGGKLVLIVKLFGCYWFCNSQIIEVFDEKEKYGFTYATLNGHVEKGKESFWVEKDESGEVSYHIEAFSRPAILLTKLGYPLVRMFQKRFAKESMQQMKTVLQNKENYNE